MNTLEFENTQGINLQYPTANVIERAVSLLIDLIIMFSSFFVLFQALLTDFMNTDVMVIVIGAPIAFFYTLLMEVFNNGRSLGKMIMGIKVIRIDGRNPTAYDYFMRWMFRWLDIYFTWGAIAALMVGGTPKSQRLGDILADTAVIRTRNLRVPLTRIFSLKKLDDHKVQYPGVKNLSEKQVLVIKETLTRSRNYNNRAHQSLLRELAKRVSQTLNVEVKKAPNVFLTAVIKDYIALTR